MLVVVDYGVGNLNAIQNMVKKIGGQAMVSSRMDDIARATQLILPGVGSFNRGVNNLRNLGLTEILNRRVIEDRIPVLGICLGMQLMTQDSEEGALTGLGWFDAHTRRFRFPSGEKQLKVPNMGWLLAKPRDNAALFQGYDGLPKFYFVHSYHCVCEQQEDVLATSHYGYEFCCSIRRDNIWGVQFHPEKSHTFGSRLLKNFLQMVPAVHTAAA